MFSESWPRVIAERAEQARRDLLVFTLSVIILTPFILAMTAFLLLMGLLYIGGVNWLDEIGLAPGSLAILSILTVAGMIRRPRFDALGLKCYGGGLLCLGAMAFLSLGTELSSAQPKLFWPLFGFLAIFELALIGRLYSARERYNLGMGPLLIDNPFSLQDDADRLDLSTGFIVALPTLLFESYSHIFGSTWLWKAPSDVSIRQATRVFEILADPDGEARGAKLKKLPAAELGESLRLLEACELVRVSERGPSLSLKGLKLAGLA